MEIIARTELLNATPELLSLNDRSFIRSERVFAVLASFFIALWILTNLIVGKYFVLLGRPFSCETITYPFIFLASSIGAEVYGTKRVKSLVITTAIVNLLVTVLIWIANLMPTNPSSPIDTLIFSQVFGLLPATLLGSLPTYFTVYFIDMYLFESLRKLFSKKHLWLRSNLSALCSQLASTAMIVVTSLVLWPFSNEKVLIGSVNRHVCQEIIIGQCFFKGLLALLSTPLVYAGVYITLKWINPREA